jgi:hypothetical protein
MANQSLDYTIIYYDPEEMEKTPSQREQTAQAGVQATSVDRALSKFYREFLPAIEGAQSKSDVLVVAALRTKVD